MIDAYAAIGFNKKRWLDIGAQTMTDCALFCLYCEPRPLVILIAFLIPAKGNEFSS